MCSSAPVTSPPPISSDPAAILDSGALERHSDPVLAQYLSALDVRITAMTPKVADDGKQILRDAQSRLQRFPSLPPEKAWGLFRAGASERTRFLYAHWTEAFRLERLLALIEPAETLFGETTRRIKEAIDENVPGANALKSSLDTAKTTLAADPAAPPSRETELFLRMLLLETLEELHATYLTRFLARPELKTATLRTIRVGLLAFSLFLAPYVYAFFNRAPPVFALFPLWSALTAGLFGAFFSRLMSLQTNFGGGSLDVIKDAREWTYILSRGFVGICGALIVFFFLRLGLLEGSLVPNIERAGLPIPNPGLVSNPETGGAGLIVPPRDLCLLVVWCFLAGFSERLVPNVLATTEKTLNNAIGKGK